MTLPGPGRGNNSYNKVTPAVLLSDSIFSMGEVSGAGLGMFATSLKVGESKCWGHRVMLVNSSLVGMVLTFVVATDILPPVTSTFWIWAIHRESQVAETIAARWVFAGRLMVILD